MTPLPVGAALMTADLGYRRDRLISCERDLELQDFFRNEVILGNWRTVAEAVPSALDGFEARVGIHRPFYGIDLANYDPEVGTFVTKRLLTGLNACRAVGADQMVVPSPFTTWYHFNFGINPATATVPSGRDAKFAQVHAILGSVVERAAQKGVTLVIENIEDIDPALRRELAESFASLSGRVSLDTGHAQHAHASTGAPAVEYFVNDASGMLAHVHLQRADGHADRHWAPERGSVPWHSVFAELGALPDRSRLVLELRDHGDIPAAIAYLEREGLACRGASFPATRVPTALHAARGRDETLKRIAEPRRLREPLERT